MISITGPGSRRALLAAALLIGSCAIGAGGAAAQGSPEAREACQADAMQFCGEYVPDVQLITKCMVAKRRMLSRACQLAMANVHKKYQRRGY